MGIFKQLATSFDDEAGWVRRPIEWSAKVGNRLWSKQREIKLSVMDNRYTACRSCHDSGKSFSAADIAAWWIDSHPIGQAFVVTTAPTAAQVKTILWQELNKVHERADLPGRINRGSSPEWFIGSTQVGMGRKPADYNMAAFQGIHSLYPLIVIDEAGGVSKAIFDAVDTFATNRNARVLAIGNPDDPNSYFAKICAPNSGWNVIHIDGLQTPNMTAERVKPFPLLKAYMEAEGITYATEAVPAVVRDVLLSPDWIEERLHRWAGISDNAIDEMDESELRRHVQEKANDSQLILAKVRGIFPPEGGGSNVIPLGWVEAAVQRWYEFQESGGNPDAIPGRRRYACDVARFGDDETAIATKQGHYVFGPAIETMSKVDTMATANRLYAMLQRAQTDESVVDVIGVGSGVVDRLRERKANVSAYNAAAGTSRKTATGQFSFPNVRSAAWWNLRELLDPSDPACDLMLPPDEGLKADLCAPRWRVAPGGKIVVEPKEDIKKRLGHSPDKGDAVVMLFWNDFSGPDEAVIQDYGGPKDGEGYAVGWEDASLDSWLRSA